MKLIYIANNRIPTEKAHGIQIMEMCASFAQNGAEVTLLVPNRKNPITQDSFEFYQVKRNFTIVKLPVIDFGSSSRFSFIVTSFSFFISVFFFLLSKKKSETIIYSRGEVALFLAYLIPVKNFFWETHSKASSMERYRKVIKRACGVITVTKYYGEELVNDFGLSRSKLLVAPDATDVEKFNIDLTKDDARKKLGLPLDKKIVLYKGHLYERKGAHVLAQAASVLSKYDIVCVFIGGTEEDVLQFKKRFGEEKNILILGNKPRNETPIYQKASDVLVIPNSAHGDDSRLYTSPIKLFSYMAGDVPIVASDLPSLREILNEKNALFFKPDDPIDLAKKIQDLFYNPDMGKKLAKQAFIDVQDNTWTKRGQRILSFIQNQFIS